jgi:hypothetical protein
MRRTRAGFDDYGFAAENSVNDKNYQLSPIRYQSLSTAGLKLKTVDRGQWAVDSSSLCQALRFDTDDL